jgi:anti-anti-sigma factor
LEAYHGIGDFDAKYHHVGQLDAEVSDEGGIVPVFDSPGHVHAEVHDPEEHVHVVALSGELDTAGADYVSEVLVEVAGSRVVADLSGLTFIDAAGIAALLSARRQISARGHELQLRGATGIVRRVFESVGLKELVD